MSIVGFNFTKINAQKNNSYVGQVMIKNNITLKDVVEAKMGLAGGNKGALKVDFSFSSIFDPNFASIVLDGEVLLLEDSKKVQEVIDGWKKSKSFPREVAEPLMNHILDRCNVQALLLSKDLNLPSPVPLPKVNVNQEGAKPVEQEEKKDDKIVKTKVKKK